MAHKYLKTKMTLTGRPGQLERAIKPRVIINNNPVFVTNNF
jgi:hypothetical protein